MSRWTIGCCVLLGVGSLAATSEGQSYEPRGRTFSQGGGWRYAPREHHVVVPGYPAWVYGGYPVAYGAVAYPGDYWPYPLRMSEMPGSPLTPPVDALPVQRSPWENQPFQKTDPAHRPVLPSSAAARLKALDFLAEGDQFVRQQKWQSAYTSYRQAVKLADDLPEAHLRYGIVFAVLGRYDRAAMEFRRAVFVDPSLPMTSAVTLESLLGPDSRLWRASILSRLAEWVEEDVADPQRLFVLGVMLHFNQDPRAQDLFSAAARLTGDAAHVTAFLPKVPIPAKDAPPEPQLDRGAQPPPAGLPAAPLPEADVPRGEGDTQPQVIKKQPAPVTPQQDLQGPVLLPPPE